MRGSKVIFSRARTDHLTPPDLFELLNNAFDFKLDPSANPDNNLGTEFFMVKSGITNEWHHSAYCNPPYNDVDTWVYKIIKESKNHPENNYVILLPSRTDRPWFSKLFETATAICFLNKRLRFWEKDKETGEFRPESYVAPFPSLAAVYSQGPHNLLKKQVDTLNMLGCTSYTRVGRIVVHPSMT
jgi:hypothetical protein